MKLKTEMTKFDKQILRLVERKEKFNNKIESQLKVLQHDRFKISLRISHLKTLSQKRCLHKKEYGRREWANNRDDASFGTYIACGKCDETLWDECYGPGGNY